MQKPAKQLYCLAGLSVSIQLSRCFLRAIMSKTSMTSSSHRSPFIGAARLSLPRRKLCMAMRSAKQSMGRITPGNGHMSTNLTLAIICGSADDAAVKAAKHCRLHRDFRFGLDGWMDFHTNLVVLETGKIFTNMGGHGDRKHLSAILKVLKKRAAAA